MINRPDSEKKNDEAPSAPVDEIQSANKAIKTANDSIKIGLAAGCAATPLPGPLRATMDIISVTADLATNSENKNSTDLICGALNGYAKNASKGILTASIGIGIAATTPTLDPISRSVVAVAIAVAAQPMIDAITSPIGKATELVCRSTINYSNHIANRSRENAISLENSQRDFVSALSTNSHSVDLSLFSSSNRPDILYTDSVNYQTALANRMYLFSNAHQPTVISRYHSSLFSNDGSDKNGWYCDSRFQDCGSASNSTHCRDSGESRCKSSLF